MKIYRFRNTKSLIDYQEVEKEEMYFASSSMQNDPMEGLSDVVWDGDHIAWENLLKNYIRNLFVLIMNYELAAIKEDSSLLEPRITIRAGFIENNPYYYQSNKAALDFIAQNIVKTMIKYFTKSADIRKFELATMLRSIQPIALLSIFSIWYSDSREYPINTEWLINLYNYQELNDKIASMDRSIKSIEDVCQGINTLLDGIKMATQLNNFVENEKNKEYLIFALNSFPLYYVSEIEKWCYPNYFLSCFTRNCLNPSMWGYYADGHKGACLIYDIPEEDLTLTIKTPPAFGLPYGEKKDLPFYEVQYQSGLEKILFFSHCLKLMQLKDELKKTWVYNDEGEKSSSLSDMFENREGWKEEYTDLVIRIASRKDADWKHEEELRLILLDYWKDEISHEGTAVKYDISKVSGIIFGINTSEEDKMKIIKSLYDKEKLNESFEVCQSYYDYESGKISNRKIPVVELLKK